jgi:hypothetical protein
MCGASDDLAGKIVELRLAESARRAIVKLCSFRDGDMGIVEVVASGKPAIPALRAILFTREPSGLYETRRRAAEALVQLHAHDVLIDYLELCESREIADPIERLGEEAVINCAARALAVLRETEIVPLLLKLTSRRPLAGVIEALGKFRTIEALPHFINALGEDDTRSAARTAILRLGLKARDALREAASLRLPSEERESVSSVRRRRSILGILAELQLPVKEAWPQLLGLMDDKDPRIAALACGIVLANTEDDAASAIRRLIALLVSADWLLTNEIEGCLVEHFDKVKVIIEGILQHGGAVTDRESPRTRTARALLRVATLAASDTRRAGQ